MNSLAFDGSWEALLKPGASDRFFQLDAAAVTNRPEFKARIDGYSPVNAWWLSEISRLIYVREADENDGVHTGRSRNGILAAVHLREYCFLNQNGIQCALITSCDNVARPFAVLVFRGTTSFEAWLSNLNIRQAGWDAGGLVHCGFKHEFFKIWEAVDECLSELPSHFSIFYTGHSLGGALATLAATRRPPSAVYTFGSPRVGDATFVHSLRHVPIFRVVNNRDLVTLLPPSRIPFDFCHAGELCHYTDGGLEVGGSAGAFFTEEQGVWRARAAYWRRRFMGPPEFLSDHAPINYSLRLEKEIACLAR